MLPASDADSHMGLDGSRAKLRRAQEHFDLIKEQIDSFLKSKPYPIVVEHPVDHLYIVRIDGEPEYTPFEDWGLLVGDCVHNLRCALDYVAWELAGADPEDKVTMFPIYEHPAGWRSLQAIRRRARLPLCAISMMESVQPYHASNPKRAALNGIRILDDADKHQLLTVTVALQDNLTMRFRGIPAANVIQRLNALDGPLHYGAVLATVVTAQDAPDLPMEAAFAPDISFAQGLIDTGNKRHRVITSLANMIKDATTVVNNFDGRFFAGYGRTYFYVPRSASDAPASKSSNT